MQGDFWPPYYHKVQLQNDEISSAVLLLDNCSSPMTGALHPVMGDSPQRLELRADLHQDNLLLDFDRKGGPEIDCGEWC
jgi:hypothetical protein